VPVATCEQAALADLLVVIGGDGTLREVAAALVESEHETPLFAVPAGRGNSSCRHLYGNADWRDVARRLADGFETRPLEVGRIESTPAVDPTYFLLGFTAGLFRSALDNAERLRVLPGPLAYLVATGQAAFLSEPVEASVAIDDDPLFDGTPVETPLETALPFVIPGRYRSPTPTARGEAASDSPTQGCDARTAMVFELQAAKEVFRVGSMCYAQCPLNRGRRTRRDDRRVSRSCTSTTTRSCANSPPKASRTRVRGSP
jgi:hypothetical protein